MRTLFELFIVIFTMQELRVLNFVELIAACVLCIVLCTFTSIKTVLWVAGANIILVIFGILAFLGGAIEGWGLLTISLPFFVGFIITGVVCYVSKWIWKGIKNKTVTN